MKVSNKIITDIKDLKACVDETKREGKKIVLCQGHFNVIHPGHLRFIEFAHEQGDFLVVAVQGEKKLEDVVKNKFFSVSERANGIASLEYVDKVFIYNDASFAELAEAVKPNIYVLGVEFSKKMDQIKDDVGLIEKFGGKVIFSSGDVRYAPTEFLDKGFEGIMEERHALFHSALSKQNITLKKLNDLLDSFHKSRILVIGDTMVDQYVACDALGMSSEAPVLVVREIEHKEFVGGAAIVARHVSALCAQCSFISLIGNDEPGRMARSVLQKENVNASMIIDEDRATTFKIRYMVGPQKVLRVSRLKDVPLSSKMEEEAIRQIDRVKDKIDGIIVSDFGYGMITPALLEHISRTAKEKGLKVFGDVQSSSQVGNVAKFKDYYILTPTEKEARIALGDKYSGLEVLGHNLLKETNAQNLIMTMGPEGFIAFDNSAGNRALVKTQHFPALNPHPLDVVGAGDSLLAGMAVSSCAGASVMEASAIGSIVASIAVGKIGNFPVTLKEIKEAVRSL